MHILSSNLFTQFIECGSIRTHSENAQNKFKRHKLAHFPQQIYIRANFAFILICYRRADHFFMLRNLCAHRYILGYLHALFSS